MDEIKYMVIYMDNSCEIHFDSNENSKLLLSSCGSEFVYRTYANNLIKNTLKYRTAYAMSIFSSKLRTILKVRNRFCNDRPFVSPILLETDNQYWMSSENFTEPKWNLTNMKLELSNPIEIDYSNFFYIWKSECKNSELKLHFNRTVFIVKYPVKVPQSQNDEYEQKCDLNSMRHHQTKSSKHIFKYTLNEQEFSVNHLPPIWEELHSKMLVLIQKHHGKIVNSLVFSSSSSSSKASLETRELMVNLPEAMPLSCTSTHLHRFDSFETTSEPKVIFLNKTWYKLFYTNKSIEISCPLSLNETNHKNQDYLVSDSQTGRYYTCYSLNQRSGDVEEMKICIENIPSFKVYIQKTINYGNILLKRVSSLKYISNYSVCYSNNKFKEIDQDKSNFPIVSIPIDKLNDSIVSSQLSKSNNNNIKKQFVVEDVGHFKYFRNNSVLVNFIDKVKLHVDEYSMKMYMKNNYEKCKINFYLPDNSQHEILYSEMNNSGHFNKYLNFLNQWFKWLIEQNVLEIDNIIQSNQTKTELNINTLQSHINELKLFNFTIKQDLNENDKAEILSNKNPNDLSLSLVSNLLKQNSKFLENISK